MPLFWRFFFNDSLLKAASQRSRAKDIALKTGIRQDL